MSSTTYSPTIKSNYYKIKFTAPCPKPGDRVKLVFDDSRYKNRKGTFIGMSIDKLYHIELEPFYNDQHIHQPAIAVYLIYRNSFILLKKLYNYND